MGLYICLALVCLDGSFRRLILCIYKIISVNDDNVVTLHVNYIYMVNDIYMNMYLVYFVRYDVMRLERCIIGEEGY